MPRRKCAAAMGFFDGMHIGHAALMQRLLSVCEESELNPVVITFDTMPQNFLYKKSIPLINSPEDKVGLIQRLFGISDVICLHFDKEMASMPWEEFIDYLIIEYGVEHFVAGKNFKFGSGAAGNCFLLQEKCKNEGLDCDIIPDIMLKGIVSSSTYIRGLLLGGDVEQAYEFLGHPHVLTDTVRSGQRLGSSLGTPTINMRFAPDVLVPAHGVYATKVYVYSDLPVGENTGESGLPGVTNIGVRPTVDSSEIVTVETHITGFNQNLYGHKVRIEFYKYLRSEMKFNNTEELKNQIEKDCNIATLYFGAKND